MSVKTWIRVLLKHAELDISGNIYIDAKPYTGKEDIVVNSVTADDNFFQANIINVNCYVPDIEVPVNGEVYRMPNTARLEEVSQMVKPIIRNAIKDQEYACNIESIRQEKDAEESASFINFSLRVNAVNY